MLGLSLQARIFASGRPPSLGFFDSSACPDGRPRRMSLLLRYRCVARSKSFYGTIRAASNINIGAGDYEDAGQTDNHKKMVDTSANNTPFRLEKPLTRIMYPLSIAAVLLGCALAFSLVAFSKSGPSILISAIAKSGFTAAFTLIFVSEIGDKTFFIAALLAMQYDKAMGIPKGFSGGDISKVFAVSVLGADIKAVHNTFLLSVLLGSMGALSLMTILSVVIGRIFHSIPAQFQTTLPIGEYAAVALLIFFGFKSIKDAWELPSEKTSSKESPELGELVEAEELVKEKVAKKLTSPLEIIWKSFSLVFFAEWGDRSMLATIALGAAQSPWGVASGAIGGHLIATSVAALGGSFLANYISEKKVGYLGGVLFLIFAVATLFGVF